MALNSQDVWGHFAPMFHLVDAFAIYAITLVGGRHAVLAGFSAQEALLMIGEHNIISLHSQDKGRWWWCKFVDCNPSILGHCTLAHLHGLVTVLLYIPAQNC